MQKFIKSLTLCFLFCFSINVFALNALLFQSDFGLKDGAVAEMKGVAYSVDNQLKIYDITHEIPAYDIWEASYRLYQTANYWPKGTVFVNIVDPGVGSARKSIVLKTKTGQYFVSPDNGSLTLVAEKYGIDQVRQIDEKTNRLNGSDKSYTFFGRDVYAYTGARLASNIISFEQVGPELAKQVVTLDYQKPTYNNGIIMGNIPVLDPQFGNIWTNIDSALVDQLKLKDGDTLCVLIKQANQLKYSAKVPFVTTFASVPAQKPLAYLNSLMNLSLALNMANFSQTYKVYSGQNWSISVKKCL